MYWCEIWTIKKAECRRINTFELWCWRRLLRVSWIVSRLNQSILKEVNCEYSWKDWCCNWSSNILVTWYEETTHWKRPRSWERLKAEGEDSNRGWDGWNALLIHGHELGQILRDGEGKWSLTCCGTWDCKESDTAWQQNTNNMHLSQGQNISTEENLERGIEGRWETLEISSRKLKIRREHFMQRWAQ